MGINEDRKKRASEFISVRHVMEAISESEGLPVGAIAGELIYYLKMPGRSPMFYRQNPATLVMSESDGAFMISLLNSIVAWGMLDWPDRSLPCPGDLDEFGWNRDEIGTFLAVFMGSLPDCCGPEWRPREKLPSPQLAHCKDASIEATGGKASSFGDGYYTTPFLDIMKAAIDQFYSIRKAVDPKKEDVTGWLKEAAVELDVALSDNVADAMFTIIKPIDHNPKRRRG